MFHINDLLGLHGIDGNLDDLMAGSSNTHDSFIPIDLDGDGIPDINSLEELQSLYPTPQEAYHNAMHDMGQNDDSGYVPSFTSEGIDLDGDGIIDVTSQQMIDDPHLLNQMVNQYSEYSPSADQWLLEHASGGAFSPSSDNPFEQLNGIATENPFPPTAPTSDATQGTFVDTDGDGVADTFVSMIDTNGDGIPDAYVRLVDMDGDGYAETAFTTYHEDTTGDGVMDTVTTTIDAGMDGSIDHIQLMTDVDGDGIPDFYMEGFFTDSDGDGIFDTLHFSQDNNMDGVFDVSGVIDSDGHVSFSDEILDTQHDIPDMHSDDWYGPDVQNFDPQHYNPDSIVGDPAGCIESFHVQEGATSCAVVSQEFVLEQLTGQDFNEGDLCRMAEAHGWFDPSPDGGTLPWNIGNVLAEFGLTIHRESGRTINDIENCLNSNGQVIVGVDSSELYLGDDDGAFVPGMQPDHAVQVIGIDKSDPSNPMVILNDSGISDGAGAMVAMNDFMNAWEDSGFLMVEAYA